MSTARNNSLTSSLVAIIVAASIATQAGGHEPFKRLVRVNGTRVHLRSGIPLQLDHSNVILHLKRGTLFSVDRISLGISAAGVGADGTWLHVTSVNDPETVGWVCARYVAEVAIPAAPAQTDQPESETGDDSPPSQADPAIILVPFEKESVQAAAMANNVLGIVNSLSNMLFLFLTTFGMRWLFGMMPARRAYAPSRTDGRRFHRAPRVGISSRTNFYGKGWWVSGKR